jgi:hypothetical protein
MPEKASNLINLAGEEVVADADIIAVDGIENATPITGVRVIRDTVPVQDADATMSDTYVNIADAVSRLSGAAIAPASVPDLLYEDEGGDGVTRIDVRRPPQPQPEVLGVAGRKLVYSGEVVVKKSDIEI